MQLPITWTPALVKAHGGGLVSSEGEICVLAWSQGEFQADSANHWWLLSSRDGMLYKYGKTAEEAAKNLNDKAVTVFHKVEKISISGTLL